MSPRYLIKRPEQIELLTSPLRQEIIGAVQSMGTCSVRELALELGTPPDSLYYHLKKLVAAGLLVSVGTRSATRRHEEVFRTPGDSMRVVFDLRNPQISDAIRSATGAALRMSHRDFDQGSRSRLARVKGRHRNLGGARLAGWLSRDENAEVNQHLDRIEEIYRNSRRGRGRTRHGLTWVMAPFEPRERQSGISL